MGRCIRFFARRIWWSMLWFMRRPVVHKLRTTTLSRSPEWMRRSAIRQDAFARRYGLGLVTFALKLLFASVLLTGIFVAVLELNDRGLLTVPDALRESIQARAQSYR